MEKKTLKGWAISIPVSELYFFKESEDVISWTNSTVEAKKFETKEEAQNFYDKLMERHPKSIYTNAQMKYIELVGYYN